MLGPLVAQNRAGAPDYTRTILLAILIIILTAIVASLVSQMPFFS